MVVRGRNVLIFDDDEAALAVMRQTLEMAGARVSVARSLDDVLHAIATESIDLVAADAMLARPRACALLIALRTATNLRARRVPFVQLRCCCSEDARSA